MVAVAEPCYMEGGMHMSLFPFAFITLGLYVIGFPVLVGALLYKNRYKIAEDQLLRSEVWRLHT